MTIAGVLTVAVSLSLFGGILMLSKWVGHGTERIKGGVRLEIFMNVDATEQQIADVRAALDERPERQVVHSSSTSRPRSRSSSGSSARTPTS